MTHKKYKVAAAVLAALGPAGALFAAGPAADPVSLGSVVFATRCAVCHGSEADGNSRLAEVMPVKPANLRKSALSDEARRQIVVGGGARVGRSPNMPAWEGELTEAELAAVLAYAASIAPSSRFAVAR